MNRTDKVNVGTWKASHFVILIFASLSTTGTNYIHDMLNVLQPVITAPIGCTNSSANVTFCCYDCLGIGDRAYNLIHTELFWTCALSLIISGYLLDKFGNWILIVLVSLTLCGAVIIAIGASLNTTSAVQPLLFIGTFLRGLGLLTSLVARGRILSDWFLGKEISCAFGAASAINRLGSIPSYMLTVYIRDAVGLPVTLWIGVCICLASLICAIAVVLLDTCSKSAKVHEIETERRRCVTLGDILGFSAQYWVLIALIGFYSGVFRSTQANGTEMIHEKFGLKKTHAAMIAGEMLYMSIVLSPLIGLLLDKTGRKGYAILAASLLHIPALALLGFSDVSPILGCFIMGLAFCCFTSVLMSSVSLLVDRSCIGIATALGQLSSTLCTGTIHLVLGEILGHVSTGSQQEKHHRWKLGLAFILSVAMVAVGLAAALLGISIRSNGVLARGPDKKTTEIKEAADEDDNGEAQSK